jgi:hypothetical protein
MEDGSRRLFLLSDSRSDSVRIHSLLDSLKDLMKCYLAAPILQL